MMRFPLSDVLDEQASYDFLLKVFHPSGLHCPNGHGLPVDQAPHDRHRAPFYDYKCRRCGKVYNVFTGTIWSGSRYACCTIVLIMRGIVQGVPTLQLAEELEINYSHLLSRRHLIQQLAERSLPP